MPISITLSPSYFTHIHVHVPSHTITPSHTLTCTCIPSHTIHTHILHTPLTCTLTLHTPHTPLTHPSALPKQPTTRTSAEQAEEVRVEREGIAVLPLPLATLYGLSHTITSTLGEGARNLKAMTVTLGVEEALMSRAQRRALNPLCITVCQARGIPSPPGASSFHSPEASDDR